MAVSVQKPKLNRDLPRNLDRDEMAPLGQPANEHFFRICHFYREFAGDPCGRPSSYGYFNWETPVKRFLPLLP